MLKKAKRIARERWALLTLAVVIFGIVAVLFFFYRPSGSSDMAAWVQGVGTMAAMLGAAWIAKDQFDWQRRAEDDRRNAGRRLELSVMRDTLAQLHAVVADCVNGYQDRAEFYRPRAHNEQRGGFDAHRFSALFRLLNEAPLEAAHGPALHVHLQRARVCAQQVQIATGQFVMAVPGAVVSLANPGPTDIAAVQVQLVAGHAGLGEALAAFEAALK